MRIEKSPILHLVSVVTELDKSVLSRTLHSEGGEEKFYPLRVAISHFDFCLALEYIV